MLGKIFKGCQSSSKILHIEEMMVLSYILFGKEYLYKSRKGTSLIFRLFTSITVTTIWHVIHITLRNTWVV